MALTFKQLGQEHKPVFNRLAQHPIQSWEWGEFREKTGNKVRRVGVFVGRQLKETYQLTVHQIPYTSYKIGVLLKGPAPTKAIIQSLKELAKKENLIFVRMEPNIVTQPLGTGKTIDFLRKNGAVPGKQMFTKETFWIDLTKSADVLLARMHPKTRYNIKVAQKHQVEIVEDNSKKAFEKYLDLTEQTVARQGFYAHTERYHKLMWETLKAKGGKQKGESDGLMAHLLTAKYQDETLITWILFVFKDTLYYPYGASSDEHRNVMASYLMMWEAILFGKKLGLSKFDLWGKEEGKGFTRFKEGFAPETVEFVGTWDLVFNPAAYSIYKTAETLRWTFLKLAAKLPLPKPTFR